MAQSEVNNLDADKRENDQLLTLDNFAHRERGREKKRKEAYVLPFVVHKYFFAQSMHIKLAWPQGTWLSNFFI